MFGGAEDVPMLGAATSMSSVALVLPGEAMWGAFQTGFVFELGSRLQAAGVGSQPFQLAIGSSSGSLIAAAAAAGGPFDHDMARSGWIQFGQATRLVPRRHNLNPYPAALQQIFKSGLVDSARAFESQTALVLTATHYRNEALAELRHDHLRLFLAGLHLFLAGSSAADAAKLSEIGASLLADGNRLFSTRYFTSKPPPTHIVEHSQRSDEDWIVVRSPEELSQAVIASSRVPFLYGNPIIDGANVLIDGVFTNNAPVQLALDFGADHVFVVTSSKKGYVFDRPVQTLFRRQLRSLLRGFDKASRRLSFLPRRFRVSDLLAHLARLEENVPLPRPLDLDALRERYPDQEIHVIHPTEKIPVNRFLESRPDVLGRLYDMGRDLAERIRG